MFKFVIKYLGFLKSIPLLPHFFDSQLKFWQLITGSEKLDCLDDIEKEVLSWKGTFITMHKYGAFSLTAMAKKSVIFIATASWICDLTAK